MIENVQLSIVPMINFQATGLYVFATIYGLIAKIQQPCSIHHFRKKVDSLEWSTRYVFL
jgi:hypothetical protein